MPGIGWRWTVLASAAALLTAAAMPAMSAQASSVRTAAGHVAGNPASWGTALNCAGAHSFNCVDVNSPYAVGNGRYVGHDEPSVLFYSNQPGSGNNDYYLLRLPKDPPVAPNQAGTGGTDNFQLHPAFWFGMAMCDSQSFPEYTTTCRPDSNGNIFNGANPSAPNYIGKHPGTAFMEMQFYPPGWVAWPAGNSCGATQWCAALNIDSYDATPTGGVNNSACLNSVGVEPVNFAFLTRTGRAQAPANPVDATLATYTPDPARDLFMNSGDVLGVSLHDTGTGFQVVIHDFTTHQTGLMTASAANGFGQVDYQPKATTCSVTPYNFHPMYSTSSTQTRVPWAAHSYNVAFADEIGHFEYCNRAASLVCTKAGVSDPAGLDGDDVYCFNASASTLVRISGCQGTDLDFDGPEYTSTWPGTGTPAHDAAYTPQPIMFTSPVFDGGHRYSQVAFEADLPRIEAADLGGQCNRTTGQNCVNPPPGAQFYPIFTTSGNGLFGHRALMRRQGFGNECVWQLGGAGIPGTTSTFGGTSTAEYGPLLSLLYPGVNSQGQPAPSYRYNNFRQILPGNPC